ncbi:hypothetical protein V5799_027864 [Amblyomma americanum]|uniref:Uncharacterized protein n=1 Tax=Amblyomma americanum TaxID=6943 RepID=A0AAQ4DEH8_AMBAM
MDITEAVNCGLAQRTRVFLARAAGNATLEEHGARQQVVLRSRGITAVFSSFTAELNGHLTTAVCHSEKARLHSIPEYLAG